MTERRQVHAEAPLGGDRQHLALLAQIAGQEDHHQHLGQLAQLHTLTATHRDPQARPVDGSAEHCGEHQQAHGREPDDVPVALEHPVVGQEHDDGAEHDAAEGHPQRLLTCQHRVNAVQLGQADSGERGHDGDEVRIAVGRAQAQHEVHHQEHHGHADGGLPRAGLQGVGTCRCCSGQTQQPQQQGGHEEEDLACAQGHPRFLAAARALAAAAFWAFVRAAGVRGAGGAGATATVGAVHCDGMP